MSAIAVSADNKFIAVFMRFDDGVWGIATSAMAGGTWKRYTVEPFATKVFFNAPSLEFSPDGPKTLISTAEMTRCRHGHSTSQRSRM